MLRSRHRSETPNFMFVSCRRTRAINVCSICLPQSSSPWSVASRAAAHVPLPRITMSKSAIRAEFSFRSRWNTARKKCPRSGVGAGYMRGHPPSQTPKSKYFQGLWVVKGLANKAILCGAARFRAPLSVGRATACPHNRRGPQKNAKARISMLSRGGAAGGEVGSSNEVWALKRERPSLDESYTLKTSASSRCMRGK